MIFEEERVYSRTVMPNRMMGKKSAAKSAAR